MSEFRSYFDSGVLVKLYHLEAGTDRVVRRAEQEPSLPLTFLAEMEVRNALRVLRGRKLFGAAVLKAALGAMDADIAAGRLQRIQPDSATWQDLAEELSVRHAPRTLCRTLDLLHVAMARVAAIPVFVTADTRQAALARRAGLRVERIEPHGAG